MEVLITDRAKEINKYNVKSIRKKHGEVAVVKYKDKIKETIEALEKFPKIGMYIEELNCYKILLVKQIYIIYKIEGNRIVIVNFWNNKQKPFFK